MSSSIGELMRALPEEQEATAEAALPKPLAAAELRPVPIAHGLGLAHLPAQLGLGLVLDAQLHKARAGRHQAGDPVGIRHHGVEAIDHAQSPSAARPRTGVEGTAMSRGSSGRAANARRPASMASANALAMATGSPASATAVLSSTAS